MSRKAKHNPGRSLLWLVAGAAGVYVLYQMMKPTEASAAEPSSEDMTTPPAGSQGLIEGGGMDVLTPILDALPGVPATPSGTAEPLPPAPEVAGSPTGGGTTTTTGGGTTTTTGGGNQGGGRRPTPRFQPRGGSASADWVAQAQIYVPETLKTLVISVRDTKSDRGKITSAAWALTIPKHDEFAVFVTRASTMSSEDRAKAAAVLIALSKSSSMTAADQRLADSRMRTLAAIEWAAINRAKPDIARMKYLYDRTNASIQYDPIKLAKAAKDSQTSSGSKTTGGGVVRTGGGVVRTGGTAGRGAGVVKR
jgi:hypothetical protein